MHPSGQNAPSSKRLWVLCSSFLQIGRLHPASELYLKLLPALPRSQQHQLHCTQLPKRTWFHLYPSQPGRSAAGPAAEAASALLPLPGKKGGSQNASNDLRRGSSNVVAETKKYVFRSITASLAHLLDQDPTLQIHSSRVLLSRNEYLLCSKQLQAVTGYCRNCSGGLQQFGSCESGSQQEGGRHPCLCQTKKCCCLSLRERNRLGVLFLGSQVTSR